MGATLVWPSQPPVPQVSTERPGLVGIGRQRAASLSAGPAGQCSWPARAQEHLPLSCLQASGSMSCVSHMHRTGVNEDASSCFSRGLQD